MRFQMPWPISGTHDDVNAGDVVVYFARIKTGVMIFCETDWKRGETERDGRAAGHVGTRQTGSIVRVARSRTTFQDECYPNIESAELRWPGLTEHIERNMP